jgi:hypothetical protein
MARLKVIETLLQGRATPEGTRRFQNDSPGIRRIISIDRFQETPSSPHSAWEYLGDCDDSEDARYTSTATAALERGVNLLDTAINYRCQRSERAIGQLCAQVASGGIRREEIFVCTKGGYIPPDRTPPATKEGYRGFLDSEYYGPGVMQPSDVVSGGHCLTPGYLDDQIDRSRQNLGSLSLTLLPSQSGAAARCNTSSEVLTVM